MTRQPIGTLKENRKARMETRAMHAGRHDGQSGLDAVQIFALAVLLSMLIVVIVFNLPATFARDFLWMVP